MEKELASKWTEQAKGLKLPEDEIVRIRQSMIDKGELENDLATVAAVTPAAFKEVLQRVAQSMKDSEQVARDNKAPVPAPKPAAGAPDPLADDDILALRHELGIHIARSARRDETMAMAQTSVAQLLEVMSNQIVALSEQNAASMRALNERLVPIEQSMRRPTAPKTAAGQLTGARQVPSPNDEPPALHVARKAFDTDLKREIKVAQSRVQQAKDDAERQLARERLRELSSASAFAASYNGEFDVLRDRFNVPTPA